jgi:hypothetical protein
MNSDKNPSMTRRSIMQMTGAALVLPAVPVSAQALEKRRMFTPTFVDFVRNYTSTTGTGNFVLEAAVNGYQSFAGAEKSGDRVYNTAAGNDRPAEFEVGRRTRQEDGTIKREPFGGAATDFSKGYKAVALVAAAEWYQAIHAGTAAAPVAVPSRDAIAALTDHWKPALLNEEGHDGVFMFERSDLSAEVAVDRRRGIFVAPASAPTGTSGAWVRKFDGPVMAHWFGTVADGSTDNHPAITAAVRVAVAIGRPTVRVPAGAYAVHTAIDPPDGTIIEGEGPGTKIFASGSAIRAFNPVGKRNFTVRDMTLRGANSTGWRGAIYADQCTNARFENLVVDGITNSTGIYLVDCDECVIDNLYFDGGPSNNGYGSYMLGCKGCKTVNSTAINCNQGFCMSGQGTDSFSTRTIEETFGNTIANCHVRNCATQAFNVNSCTYSTVANCHAEDYVGGSTHKAFQVKDAAGFERSSRGNVIIGCTVKNYAAGFGVVRASHAQFIGCTGRDLSTNGIELVAADSCQFIGCDLHEFRQAGIWTSGGTSRCHFNNISLETSTAKAKGILIISIGGTDGENNFDNITTKSKLAAFIDIAAIARNNRFGNGCRANGQLILDASTTTLWPMCVATPVFSLSSGATTVAPIYFSQGLQVAVARFVPTESITGAPSISVSALGNAAAIAGSQAVSGAAGEALLLVRASQRVSPGSTVTANVTGTGSAGAGFVQLEGLPWV